MNPYWTHPSFDGLVATVQAGLRHNDGFGIGAKAKASVLSGRATAEFNIFCWQVDLGVNADVLSIGAEATIGIFPTEDGGKHLMHELEFHPAYLVGALLFE